MLAVAAARRCRLRADDPPLGVRITSPLGRTGTPGAVRIVARVEHAGDAAIQGVKFFVDGTARRRRTPTARVYAVEWIDDNPFEPTVITVEVADAKGRTRDRPRRPGRLRLRRAGRGDRACWSRRPCTTRRAGRSPASASRGFVLEEDGARQKLEVVRPEVMPATYALLVDSSQSIAHGVGFLRDAATRFMRYLRPRRSRARGAVLADARRRHRADQRRRDRPRRAARRPARRRHRDLDAIVDTSEMIRRREGRHVIVLLTDGYDEHSVATRDDAIHAVQSLGRDRLRDRHRRRRRHLA